QTRSKPGTRVIPMARTPWGERARHQDWPANGRAFEAPAGLRVLVPGWPQFSWGQRDRGWVLLGSFAFAGGGGLLTWGTWVGWTFFAFAFFAHVSSSTDAIRQASFPVYPRRAAILVTAGSLALVLYLPSVTLLLATAWPGFSADRASSGYLVNSWAYRD